MIIMMSKFDSIYALIEDSSPSQVAVASAAKSLLKQRIYQSFFFLLFSFSFSCIVFSVYCTVHAGSQVEYVTRYRSFYALAKSLVTA